MEDWKNEFKATLEKALQKKAELILRSICASFQLGKNALSDDLSDEFKRRERETYERFPQLMQGIDLAMDAAVARAYIKHGEKDTLALIRNIRLFLRSESEEEELSCRD